MQEWQEWLKPAIELAKEAGKEILKYFGAPAEKINVSRKRDNTFLTEADLCAQAIIGKGLKSLTPSIPILSEEDIIPPFVSRQKWSMHWLVDPLDGTRGFIQHSDEFTVNIALVYKHQPVMGVVYTPVPRSCYFASKGEGAFKQIDDDTAVAIHTTPLDWSSYRVLLGQHLRSSDLPDALSRLPGCHVTRLNSSLKFCWLAEGKADIYPRFGDTSEWDTAAAQCVLEAAGGAVLDFTGEPLQYNARVSLVNPAFVAIGDLTQKTKIIELIQQQRREK